MPVYLMLHYWVADHYDDFGIIKTLESIFIPMICQVTGEKMDHDEMKKKHEGKAASHLNLHLHSWIVKFYDPFGIVRLLENMYLPWVYLFLG